MIFTDLIRTSQETHYISATEPNRLKLFGETVAVYCENNAFGHVAGIYQQYLCGQVGDLLVHVREVLGLYVGLGSGYADCTLSSLRLLTRLLYGLYGGGGGLVPGVKLTSGYVRPWRLIKNLHVYVPCNNSPV
jgi:hypothetical protein